MRLSRVIFLILFSRRFSLITPFLVLQCSLLIYFNIIIPHTTLTYPTCILIYHENRFPYSALQYHFFYTIQLFARSSLSSLCSLITFNYSEYSDSLLSSIKLCSLNSPFLQNNILLISLGFSRFYSMLKC